MMKEQDRISLAFEFPERLWKRPIEFHEGKPRIRFAASSYSRQLPYGALRDGTGSVDSDDDRRTSQDAEIDHANNTLTDEPQVEVSSEAGNAKVTVQPISAEKQNLSLRCAEDSVSLSIRTPEGSWTKEVHLPFRVDPDTAKAVFRNRRLELIVRRHGRFNPPRPKLDWV